MNQNRTSVIIAATILIACLFSCKNDNVRDAAKAAAIEEATPELISSKSNEGKIVTVTPEKISLDNTKEIMLPADDSLTTLFLVRAAENTPGKSGLTEVGLARAGYLATLLQNAKLAQAYSESGSDAMQTALLSARANQCELNYFQLENTAFTLRTIVHNFRGKKVLIVGSPAMLSKVIGDYTNNPKVKIPDDEYDHFFVALVKSAADIKVHHLVY